MFTPHGSVQAFHSMECFKEKRYGEKAPQRINTPRKKIASKVRRKVRDRDHGRCRLCHRAGENIQVHHIVYRSEGGDHDIENLISLCYSCHEKVHSDKKTYQRSLLEMISRQGGATERYCIYHGGCPDGFTSAWLMHMAYPDIILHKGVYGEDPPCIKPGSTVFLVDFSYDRDTIITLAAIASKVVILDHHKTAVDNLVDLPGNVDVYLDMHMCGAAITLDHLEWSTDWGEWATDWDREGQDISYLHTMVFYIEDFDLWKKKLKDTNAINAFVQSSPYTFEAWDSILSSFSHPDSLSTLVSSGEAILMRDGKVVSDIVDTAREVTIGGYDVLAVGSPYAYGSTVAGILATERPFGAYYVDRPEGRQYGLRSLPNTVDVSAVAANYGGGGHVQASGFKVPWGHPLAPS